MSWMKMVQGTTNSGEVPKVKVSRWGTNVPQEEHGMADLWHSGCQHCASFKRDVVEQESRIYGTCPFKSCDIQIAGKKHAEREMRIICLREEQAEKLEIVRLSVNGLFLTEYQEKEREVLDIETLYPKHESIPAKGPGELPEYSQVKSREHCSSFKRGEKGKVKEKDLPAFEPDVEARKVRCKDCSLMRFIQAGDTRDNASFIMQGKKSYGRGFYCEAKEFWVGEEVLEKSLEAVRWGGKSIGRGSNNILAQDSDTGRWRIWASYRDLTNEVLWEPRRCSKFTPKGTFSEKDVWYRTTKVNGREILQRVKSPVIDMSIVQEFQEPLTSDEEETVSKMVEHIEKEKVSQDEQKVLDEVLGSDSIIITLQDLLMAENIPDDINDEAMRLFDKYEIPEPNEEEIKEVYRQVYEKRGMKLEVAA